MEYGLGQDRIMSDTWAPTDQNNLTLFLSRNLTAIINTHPRVCRHTQLDPKGSWVSNSVEWLRTRGITINPYPNRRVFPREPSRTQQGVTNFGPGLDRTTLHPEIDPYTHVMEEDTYMATH